MVRYADVEVIGMAGEAELVSGWLKLLRALMGSRMHQRSSVDPRRSPACETGTVPAPIAHGFLTLSLLSYLTDGSVEIDGTAMVELWTEQGEIPESGEGRRSDPRGPRSLQSRRSLRAPASRRVSSWKSTVRPSRQPWPSSSRSMSARLPFMKIHG